MQRRPPGRRCVYPNRKMIRQVRYDAILATAFFLSLAVNACRKDNPDSPSDSRVEVVSVSLSASELALEQGQTAQLTATVLPSDATDPSVAWSSSAPTVATVSAAGLVSAVSAGTATVSARAGNQSATCVITVSKPYVGVQSVTLDRTFIVLSQGETLALKATVLPEDASRPTVAWAAARAEIAGISEDGVISAVKEGQTTISAEADGVRTTCQVTVLPPPPAPDRIEYTSQGGVVVTPYNPDAFGARIISNTYQDGVGVIQFDAPVTQVGEKAFYRCGALTGIRLPAGVTKIGTQAFSYTTLMQVTMQNKVEEIGNNAFGWCSALTSIFLTDRVARVDDSAFRSCSALRQIVFPEGIREIKSAALMDCISLQSLQIYALTPPSLGNRALDNSGNGPILVPAAAVETYKAATGWKSYSSRIRAFANN